MSVLEYDQLWSLHIYAWSKGYTIVFVHSFILILNGLAFYLHYLLYLYSEWASFLPPTIYFIFIERQYVIHIYSYKLYQSNWQYVTKVSKRYLRVDMSALLQ